MAPETTFTWPLRFPLKRPNLAPERTSQHTTYMHECRQTDARSSQHALFSFVQVWMPLFSWHTKHKTDSFLVPVLMVIVPVLAVAPYLHVILSLTAACASPISSLKQTVANLTTANGLPQFAFLQEAQRLSGSSA